ncbi:MAG: cytochrome c oxidase subunit 3 [Flavobacteriaceae bacterium]|nr:cytochrome c oxidase subunit 3 [Flavobacteriaceae bacterium]
MNNPIVSNPELEKDLKEGKKKTGKPMLWVSMISMTMMFAGLTSGYVISQGRADWVNFEMPTSFFISTFLIILSSFTIYMSKRMILADKMNLSRLLLVSTFVLGILFVYFQFEGFGQLIEMGLYFTGKQSSISSSFMYVLTIAHVLHILAGILVLMAVIYNHYKLRYTKEETFGLELASIFWHFVDALWIYLFFFFYFIK